MCAHRLYRTKFNLLYGFSIYKCIHRKCRAEIMKSTYLSLLREYSAIEKICFFGVLRVFFHVLEGLARARSDSLSRKPRLYMWSNFGCMPLVFPIFFSRHSRHISYFDYPIPPKMVCGCSLNFTGQLNIKLAPRVRQQCLLTEKIMVVTI